MESNDCPEIPDRRETSDIPGLPSGVQQREEEEGEQRQTAVVNNSIAALIHTTKRTVLGG